MHEHMFIIRIIWSHRTQLGNRIHQLSNALVVCYSGNTMIRLACKIVIPASRGISSPPSRRRLHVLYMQ